MTKMQCFFLSQQRIYMHSTFICNGCQILWSLGWGGFASCVELAQVIMDYRATLKADPDIQKVLLQAIAETSDPDIAQCIQRHSHKVYLLVRPMIASGGCLWCCVFLPKPA